MAVMAGAEAAGGGAAGGGAAGGAAGGGAAGGGAAGGEAGGGAGKGLGGRAAGSIASHAAHKHHEKKDKNDQQPQRSTLTGLLLVLLIFLVLPMMPMMLILLLVTAQQDQCDAAAAPAGSSTGSGAITSSDDGTAKQYHLDMNAAQLANARIVVQVASDLGLPQRAAEIALATALVESKLDANPGSHPARPDGNTPGSLGMFQQLRAGWGPDAFRLDPRKAAVMFYVGGVGGGAAPGLNRIDWRSQSLNDAAQAVQRSAYPDKYGEWATQAESTTAQVWAAAQAQTRRTGIYPNDVRKEIGQGFSLSPWRPVDPFGPEPGQGGISSDPADTDVDDEATNEGETANDVLASAPSAGAACGDTAAVGTATGTIVSVPCPGTGGSIKVDRSIAANLGNLLAASVQAGYGLCGGGYRSTERQIELRRDHCGTSYEAIYTMASSACSPPTAVPGHSMHEKGLAIDFTSAGNDTGFDWLKAHSEEFGLKNFPKERWHYSTNGN